MERRLKLKKILTRFVTHCESFMQDIETVVLVIRFFLMKFFFQREKNCSIALVFFPDNSEIPTTPQTQANCQSTKILSCACDYFSLACVFSIFLFLTGWEFRVNSLQVLSHIMADISVVTTLFSYLMHNQENQHLPKATAVINIQNGLTSVLAIIVAYVVDTCTGLFNVMILKPEPDRIVRSGKPRTAPFYGSFSLKNHLIGKKQGPV